MYGVCRRRWARGKHNRLLLRARYTSESPVRTVAFMLPGPLTPLSSVFHRGRRAKRRFGDDDDDDDLFYGARVFYAYILRRARPISDFSAPRPAVNSSR